MTKRAKKTPPESAAQEDEVGPITTALLDARQRVAVPGAHTRGAYARDKEERSVAPNNPAAVCWCSAGSLMRTFHPPDTYASGRGAYLEPKNEVHRRAYELLAQASKELMGPRRQDPNSITVVNDGAGREGALKMFNMAIKEAKGS
jgi:hypothetical protein